MSEPAERTVKGQQVVIEGIPVTVEMDRGVLVIHVGNLPDDGPYSRNVRLTVATETGTAGWAENRTARRLEKPLAGPAPGMPPRRLRLRDYWDDGPQAEKI